ncbi:MFS transporter, YNFM family, putative membrane transport protein [Nocardioides exalbidus]|uniref:MFS transporter, YNFM family, putative membrane transport protein n=1 Tax=Nocardioides exalbidus TaxID=402596 RepID=A0A1H4KY96_9ACTN|nr:MFS transporter [Nocardioides exalbidus]SEB63393.1 MFS transporter, YNFM family, putative membrane transport protein [Nocardioides exalbidus]
MTTAHALDAEPGTHLPGTAGYRRLMVATFLAGMATFVVLYDVQALLPDLARAYDVTPARATLALSLTTAALAVALLVAGPVSEVVGRTRLIHLSLWSASVVALACAVAPSWEWLLALRTLQGITLAGLPAVATAYLREELHHSAHGRAFGLYIAGTALGGMAGRLVTAPVADLAGWRWGLAAAGTFALFCAALVAWLLPASRHFSPGPAGIGSVVSGARDAVRDPALVALYVLGGCGIGTMVAVFNGLGFRLSEAPYGLSAGAVSLVYLVYALGSVSSATAGRVADRIGRRATIPVGCGFALAGVWLTLSGSLVFVVLGMAALTVGFFCIHGLASGWVTSRAHLAGVSTGQAASFYTFTYYVGASVFGNLGSVAWSHAGWDGVVALASALLLTVCAMVVVLRRTPALPQPA